MQYSPACVLLFFLMFISAASADSLISIGITTEPSSIPVHYDKSAGSGYVVLTTSDEKGLPDLVLRASRAVSGSTVANITFPDNGGRDFIRVPATQQLTRRIPIDVTGLDVPGTYEGQVDIALQAEGSLLATTTIHAVRDNSNFLPVIGGPAYKNDQIEYSVEGDDSVASFWIANPQTARARDYVISVEGNLNGAIVPQPDTFSLAPGEQKNIFVTANSNLKLGTFLNTIKISDASDKKLSKEVLIHVTRVRAKYEQTAILFGLVLLGALLSLLLNNIFPVTLAKKRVRSTLSSLDSRIRASVDDTSLLSSTLLAETARIRLLSNDIAWYTTTKQEQIKIVDNLIAELTARVAVADAVHDLRNYFGEASDIAVRAILQAEQRLCEAEDHLVDGKPDLAQTIVDEVGKLRTDATTSAAITALRAELEPAIKALLATFPSDPARPSSISYILEDLTSSAPSIATLSDDGALDLERKFQIARIYLQDFERALKRVQGWKDFQTMFVSLLSGDVASPKIELLTSLMLHEITPNMIADEIKNEQCDITGDSKVRACQMTEFRLEFRDPAIQGVPAARRLCGYSWSFDDTLSTPTHDRCSHFFRRGSFLKRWMTRKPSARTFSVTVTPPCNLGQQTTFEKTITLLPMEGRGFGAIGIQVFTFIISFLVAVAAAYGTQYATLPTLDSLSTIIAPFLFGFSLDQIRDKAQGTN